MEDVTRDKARSSSKLFTKTLIFIVPLCLISLEVFLNIVVVCTVVNAVLLMLFVTSPLWLLLMLFWWPLFVFGFCVLKSSSIRTYARRIMT